MLLRIIDVPAHDDAEDAVKLVLEDNHHASSFICEQYQFPQSANFKKTLHWYFNDYLLRGDDPAKGGKIAEDIIRTGQHLGEALLGEDHQLIHIKEQIEDAGYQNLQVRIESDRSRFLAQPWETLILPDASYVLSAVSKSFTRCHITETDGGDYAPLHFHMQPVQRESNEVNQLFSEQTPQGKGQFAPEKEETLNILYLVSRPEKMMLDYSESNSLNLSLSAAGEGRGINYRVLKTLTPDALADRLTAFDEPVHVFHYDGPLLMENNLIHLVMTSPDGEALTISGDDFCKVLAQAKVPLLAVSACALSDGEESDKESSAAKLALLARSALTHGLNLLGLSQFTNPWIGGQCLNAVYQQLTLGHNLAQAVVEARKSLQSSTELSLMTANALPFHYWSLLTHYGIRPLCFFDPAPGGENAPAGEVREAFHDMLYGFRTEMLPPLLNQIGDGQALTLVDSLVPMQEQKSPLLACIRGGVGCGKTQLAHVANVYQAQKQHIDLGFYFDFAQGFYSREDMLAMIAPVLGADSEAKTLAGLKKVKASFVLDNLEADKLNASEELVQGLSLFLQGLLEEGHQVMLLSTGEGWQEFSCLYADKLELALQPLTASGQKILAARQLQDFALAGKENHQDFSRLLAACQGEPWLIKKVLPLLAFEEPRKLASRLEEISGDRQQSNIGAFYQWQWRELPPVWQGLLLLSYKTPNLLLEMLMTAAEQPGGFKPASELFQLLGQGDAKLSEGLKLLERRGFVRRLPHGRILDDRCFVFLEQQAQTFCRGQEFESMSLQFSQVVCEGIRILCHHVLKQPNPFISNNLLFNRRHWVGHFEKLWFARDYSGFFSVKGIFEQLLMQAKVAQESQAWSLDLLNRSELPVMEAPEQVHAWLVLATAALKGEEAQSSECLKQGAEIFRHWFDASHADIDETRLRLFQRVADFLEGYYLGHDQWQSCLDICEKAYKVYLGYQAWQKVIQVLKSQVSYQAKLGNNEQALVLEEQILTGVPYEGAPEGFKAQQMVDILFARLGRNEAGHAQSLLDQLRAMEDAEKLSDMLDGIQCDIDYQQGDYARALPFYAATWERALKAEQQSHLQQLKPRLLELEEKLGEQAFNRLFEQAVSHDTLKPRQYTSRLH